MLEDKGEKREKRKLLEIEERKKRADKRMICFLKRRSREIKIMKVEKAELVVSWMHEWRATLCRRSESWITHTRLFQF